MTHAYCPDSIASERNARMDNVLSHLYDMQMLQLRMSGVKDEWPQQLSMDYPLSEHSTDLCRVGIGFEEIFDDDDATDKEKA
ncbi:hypothetical protein HAX54_022915 [Datura stramonium]|uniref:Uncharacterized protein n=1 Tax=Datura stramonium TaxID=4076 RepID=A0ABS8UWE5_DATST|nr:hypothetical protein [Datura stramonium]